MWNDNVKQTNNNRRWIIMKKSIKKLIKSNNIELKAEIKEIKKQYKKDIKELEDRYSKQIENIKAENEKVIKGQKETPDEQEKEIENKYNVEVGNKDLGIQNPPNEIETLKAKEVKPRTKNNKANKQINGEVLEIVSFLFIIY